MNLVEIGRGIVHADGCNGLDYTLCGVSAENMLNTPGEYGYEECLNETETEPYMMRTNAKISCEQCAAIIRYCCKLGVRALKKGCVK